MERNGSSEERIKGAWNPEEDAMLVKLVELHGAKNWTAIRAGIPSRSGKSCQLRWFGAAPTLQARRGRGGNRGLRAAQEQVWATIARLL